MNKEALVKRLEEIKQKSDSVVVEITQHEGATAALREEALRLQGRYVELEEQLNKLESEEKEPKKGKVTKDNAKSTS